MDVRFKVDGDDSLSWVALAVSPNAKAPVCTNGDPIYDGSVVEFKRDDTQRKWIPCRVRHDKSKGNDMSAAMNVWRSITTSRVDLQEIRGEHPIADYTSSTEAEYIYYDKRFDREHSASRAMLYFHNTYVKRWLLNKLLQDAKTKAVFDLACGKGGDLGKFLDAGRDRIELIVGADKCPNNILDVNDGACVRAMDMLTRSMTTGHTRSHHHPRRIPRVAFIPGLDMLNDLKDDQLSSKTPHGEPYVDLLWNGKLQDQKKFVGEERKFLESNFSRKLGKSGCFDMVWCSFAVHYFFESEKTIQSLIHNIDYLLKDGGYFVGTCLDGRLVDQALARNKGGDLKGLKGGRIMWSIKPLYDVEENKRTVGRKIRVFMETINQAIDEYLVDFDVLTEMLRAKGIVPVSSDECSLLGLHASSSTFKDIYDIHDDPRNAVFQRHVASKISSEEKMFSFMNRWFVFKKDAVVVSG
jgi:SAM-dependent methyltransferase